MKALAAVALALALCAGSYAEDAGWVEMAEADASTWDLVATLVLCAAVWRIVAGND